MHFKNCLKVILGISNNKDIFSAIEEKKLKICVCVCVCVVYQAKIKKKITY